jgi:hypothetical protein
MDIKTKMNRAMLEVKRFGREFNVILLGKKEMEEIENTVFAGINKEDYYKSKGWRVKLIGIDQDYFCKAVYITDSDEGQKKLFGELTSK